LASKYFVNIILHQGIKKLKELSIDSQTEGNLPSIVPVKLPLNTANIPRIIRFPASNQGGKTPGQYPESNPNQAARL
jgi:hypothetical protein